MNASVKIIQGWRTKTDGSGSRYPVFENWKIPNTRIYRRRQNKHIKSTGKYESGKSYFNTDLSVQEIDKIVLDAVGTGVGEMYRDFSVRETVVLDRVVGKYIENGKEYDSHTLRIHYSNEGIHAYTVKDED